MATPSSTASNGDNNRYKTVTGYPAPAPAQAQPTQPYAAGYPPPNTNPNPYPNPNSAPPPQTATAYPYQYPPQNGNYYHQYAFQSDRQRSVVRRLVITAIAAFVIVGLAFFITWLVLKPREPVFRLDSATVSGLNVTQSELSAAWAFSLFIRNPNTKLKISYEELQANVIYGGDQFGSTQLRPFQQGKREEETVNFRLAALSAFVGDKTVKRINDEKQTGSVNFGVRLTGWVRFQSGFWRMREHMLRVNCHPVQFGFVSNNGTGVFRGPSKTCDVSL